MNKYDIRNWVLGVINSCITIEQSINCRRLVKNYFNRFGGSDGLFDLWLDRHNALRYADQLDNE